MPPRDSFLGNQQEIALRLNERGRAGDAEMTGELALLVEVEPTLVSFHGFEGRTIDKDDLSAFIRSVTERPLDFGGIVAIHEDELLGEPRSRERINPLPTCRDQIALVVADVVLDDDRGIEFPRTRLFGTRHSRNTSE